MTIKQPKHLLVLVGLSPAVASETYYALRRQGDVVGAISIITTAAGIAKAKEQLDGPDGAIRAINALRFSPEDGVIDPPSLRFIVLNDQNHRPMDDLLSPKDHEAMVRIINQTVLSLTEDEEPPLHASLAGGRKTMAGALGSIMSLHARAEDCLSHVLAGPGLESNPNLMFPLPGSGPEFDVSLVEMPFVRVRSLIGNHERQKGYEALIACAQNQIDAPITYFEIDNARLMTNDGAVLLSPLQSALLMVLHKSGELGLNAQNFSLDDFLIIYRRAGGSFSQSNALKKRLKRDGPETWISEHISRLRKKLRPVSNLSILTIGNRPNSHYVLKVIRENSFTVIGEANHG